jgi:hypothetical protein
MTAVCAEANDMVMKHVVFPTRNDCLLLEEW